MPDFICQTELAPDAAPPPELVPVRGEVLAAVKHAPLSGRTVVLRVAEGESLAAMVWTAFPDAMARRYVVASIGGREIPQDEWESVRPSAGDVVRLVLRPGDGDTLRTILTVALVVATAWIAGPAGAALVGSTWAPVLAAGVAIVGNLLINALVPLELPGARGAAPEPFHTITGARNRNPLGGPAPLVFGRHRHFPPVWGLPVQETVGDEVYLRIPYLLGPAPVAISELRIGDTLLSGYADVDVETRLTADAPAHLLYAGDPDQDLDGAELTTSFLTRTTAADVDEIDVVVGFRGGLGALNDKGRKVSASVGVVVEYRHVDDTEGDWSDLRATNEQALVAATEAIGEPDLLGISLIGIAARLNWQNELAELGDVASGAYPFTRADPGRAFQRVIRFVVPRGQWDVRVRRTTEPSGDSSVQDKVWLEILGSRKSFVDPFPERNLASIVLRIKASAQLSGVIDTFNCVTEPLIPVFTAAALADPAIATPATFEADPEISRDPAELILNLYRGIQNKRPRPDARINFPSFARFSAFCQLNGLHFDEVVDGRVARGEMARRIAAAGYGRLYRQGGQLHVAIDYERPPEELPAQVFTSRNVANLRWQKTFPAEVHAVRVAFRNAANGWQDDEVIIYADGYDVDTATIIEDLPVPGKTDADEVRVVGRQYFNNGQRQTEQFSFDMDAESLTVTLGALCELQHEAIGVGLGAQRVAEVLMDAGEAIGFVLDDPIATTAGPTLGCRWRHLDDDGFEAWFEVPVEVEIVRDAADARRFTFAEPRDPAEAPALGELVLVGVTELISLPVIVRDIDPDYGDRAAITVIPYAPERFTPDGSPLPAHDPKVTLAAAGRPAQPILLSAIARNLEIAVSFWQPASPRGVMVTGYEAAVRETGASDDQWGLLAPLRADERTVVAPAGDPGAKYDVKIEALGVDARGTVVRSDPLIVPEIDANDAPPQPAGCTAVFVERVSTLGARQLVLETAWTPNENPDVLQTNIEIFVSGEVWAVVGGARAAIGTAEVHGLQVGRTYQVGFVHISRRGAPSVRTVVADVTAPDILFGTGIGPNGSVGGRTASQVISDLDSNAESVANEILLNAAWRASQEALLWIGGETVGAVAIESRELNETSAGDLLLLGARNEAGTAFILNADTVTVPAGDDEGSSAITLKALRTTVDGNTADLVFLLESIEGVYAQATLTTNVNGLITGFKFWNDGTPENSGFVILAPNFAVADPGNGLSDPQYIFVVSGGVVSINATLAAENITTGSLSVGRVAIDSLTKISNYTVTADTDIATSINPSTAVPSSWTQIGSFTVVTSGGALNLQASVQLEGDSSNANKIMLVAVDFEIRRASGGAVVGAASAAGFVMKTHSGSGVWSKFGASILGLDAPDAGSNGYEIYGRVGGHEHLSTTSGADVASLNIDIVAIENIRTS